MIRMCVLRVGVGLEWEYHTKMVAKRLQQRMQRGRNVLRSYGVGGRSRDEA
jgi:hypothetical protein